MKNRTVVVAFLSRADFAVAGNRAQATSQRIDKLEAETKDPARAMKDCLMPVTGSA